MCFIYQFRATRNERHICTLSDRQRQIASIKRQRVQAANLKSPNPGGIVYGARHATMHSAGSKSHFA
jgi:hypothetical protein